MGVQPSQVQVKTSGGDACAKPMGWLELPTMLSSQSSEDHTRKLPYCRAPRINVRPWTKGSHWGMDGVDTWLCTSYIAHSVESHLHAQAWLAMSSGKQTPKG